MRTIIPVHQQVACMLFRHYTSKAYVCLLTGRPTFCRLFNGHFNIATAARTIARLCEFAYQHDNALATIRTRLNLLLYFHNYPFCFPQTNSTASFLVSKLPKFILPDDTSQRFPMYCKYHRQPLNLNSCTPGAIFVILIVVGIAHPAGANEMLDCPNTLG